MTRQGANQYDMTLAESVKARSLVAVIASKADLRRATRLRQRPEFFELRLDAVQPSYSEMPALIAQLARPLIVTARHPNEGGRQRNSLEERRRLLRRYLPWAALVDVELRSVHPLRSVLQEARERNVKCILSVHCLRQTPSLHRLQDRTQEAENLSPDVFKIVTRTDTASELAQLLEFFEENKRKLPMTAMGVGKLGRLSRVKLMQAGSVLNYAHLGESSLEGQLSLAEARRWRNKSLS